MSRAQAQKERVEACFEAWLMKDLWDERELSYLLCGIDPDAVNLTKDSLSEINSVAKEAIKRAVLSRRLAVISPVDATDGDRVYGHDRFFRPAEAIKWAAATGRFSRFPWKCDDVKEGVTITLPYTTRYLEAMFKVMRENHVETQAQKEIAIEIDKLLPGFNPQTSPSRLARDLATAIRPDEEAAADRRRARSRQNQPTPSRQ